MSRHNLSLIYWLSALAISLILCFHSLVYAQNLSSQMTQWLQPLDLGSNLRIQRFNGSLVEMLSDCPSKNACHSLKMENNTLKCVPSSQDKDPKGGLPNENMNNRNAIFQIQESSQKFKSSYTIIILLPIVLPDLSNGRMNQLCY